MNALTALVDSEERERANATVTESPLATAELTVAAVGVLFVALRENAAMLRSFTSWRGFVMGAV